MIKMFSGLFLGMESLTVEIEIDIKSRMKGFDIIGLPSTAVRESTKRVETAIINSGIHFPGKQIIVNLAPAGIKKIGTMFDLAIALGIISEELEISIPENIFILGELSLDGCLRSVPGALLLCEHAKKSNFLYFMCPEENAKEASLIEGIKIIPIKSLKEAFNIIQKNSPIRSVTKTKEKKEEIFHGCFQDVKGQDSAKRALEIAAAGNHNILMIGDPGSGKTMLASRLPGILPKMNYEECLETSKIQSMMGISSEISLIESRPFRSPHHSSSDIAIIGGGKIPRPGEISLAHNGVLFLDELQEFKSSVIQSLRQPLEEKKIIISRAEKSMEFPANFLFVGAMNPSRYKNNFNVTGDWKVEDIEYTIKKLSYPFLDRIDMHIQVSKVSHEQILSSKKSDSSEKIRSRVKNARNIQKDRFKKYGIRFNSEVSSASIEKTCNISQEAKNLLMMAMKKLNLSLRSHDKIIKCARTIADLKCEEKISENDISEALQYRSIDSMLRFY